MGITSLGYQVVWATLAQRSDVDVRRLFTDQGVPPHGGGRGRGPQLDLFGLSLSWELDGPVLLDLLEQQRIPIWAADRGDADPIVFGGGPVLTANPEPLAPFFDVVLLGDGELLLPAFVDALQAHREAPRAERLIANTLRVYDASSSRFVSRRSHAAKREAVSRAATAEALRLTRQQLSVLLEDALATFRAELVLLMAASARYDRASTRLSRKTTRRFERAVRAAMPAPIGARPQGVALQRRSVRRLRQRLLIEAAAHEAEAAALPPREQDVGPSPWWKQLLVQAIQIVLNLAQGYLLQYLPAKRKDLADERAMPRGPLF